MLKVVYDAFVYVQTDYMIILNSCSEGQRMVTCNPHTIFAVAVQTLLCGVCMFPVSVLSTYFLLKSNGKHIILTANSKLSSICAGLVVWLAYSRFQHPCDPLRRRSSHGRWMDEQILIRSLEQAGADSWIISPDYQRLCHSISCTGRAGLWFYATNVKQGQLSELQATHFLCSPAPSISEA